MKRLKPAVAAALLLVIALGTLALGFNVKEQCTTHQWDGYQYRHSCYNDIYALYFGRGLIKGRFPYLHSTPETRQAEEDIEYPVGTGLYMGAVMKLTSTPRGYFNITAIGLAIAGLIAVWTTALLAKNKSRVLYLALAPTMVLYAFHNWDLLAVALTATGLLAFHRDRDILAGIALGVGASTKLYPAFIIPALLLVRWRDKKSLWPLIASFGGATLLMNVPIFLANRQGWLYPWKFQSRRFTNFETSWYNIFRHLQSTASQQFWFHGYVKIMNVASGALFGLGSLLLLWRESKREQIRGYALSFGILVIWLLTAKVYSPQYMLWLLPFFVLLALPWYSYVAFAVTDAAVWIAISAFFLGADHPRSAAFRLDILEITVWARYAVLLWLLWLSRRVLERVVDRAPSGTPAVSPEMAPSEA